MFKMAENSPRCIGVTSTHPITHPMQGQKKEENIISCVCLKCMMQEIFKQSILTKLQPIAIAKFEPRTAAPHKCHPIQVETGQTNFTLCRGGLRKTSKVGTLCLANNGFRWSVPGEL